MRNNMLVHDEKNGDKVTDNWKGKPRSDTQSKAVSLVLVLGMR